MSAEVGAASVLEELLELLEVDLSTAATAVCKYTNPRWRWHFALRATYQNRVTAPGLFRARNP